LHLHAGYDGCVAEDPDAGALREAMKKVAVELKRADIPFALAGGYAAFARGGPESDHDVDFYLRQDDVQNAEKVLDKAGLRVEYAPEDWLVKVYDGEAMVDLIHSPTDLRVTTDLLDRADELEVDSVEMPVLSATDLMLSKLLALKEHYCDFGSLFPVVRALREQIDWPRLGRETTGNPFAQAFLGLVAELGLTCQ
jgi:predicted nucleotidyltransferase